MPISTRLEQVLALLDYQNAKAPHHRSNLVLAIQLFAAGQGDTTLEAECEVELAHIRADIEQARNATTKQKS